MINLTKYIDEINLYKKTVKSDASELVLCLMNLDDIFCSLANIGSEEVEVNKEQMMMIARWFAADATNTELGVNAVRDGKIDKLLGIKLKLI